MITRTLTPDEIQSYRESGVVRLRSFLDLDWVKRAEGVFERVMAAPCEPLKDLDASVMAENVKQLGAELLAPPEIKPEGRFRIRTFLWREFPELEKLGCSGPLPEVAARLMGSGQICFYGDQLFLKGAGSVHRTAFHQDAGYFHLEGDQCCTIWIPFDRVNEENGVMGYIRGSHRWKVHGPNVFVSQMTIPGSTGPRLPDIEGHESDYDIVYLEAEPGDAIVHHVKTVHGATGNTSTSRQRRALALRYLGDDVRYLERDGAPPDSQKSATLRDGDPMDSPEFPLIWTAESGNLR